MMGGYEAEAEISTLFSGIGLNVGLIALFHH